MNFLLSGITILLVWANVLQCYLFGSSFSLDNPVTSYKMPQWKQNTKQLEQHITRSRISTNRRGSATDDPLEQTKRQLDILKGVSTKSAYSEKDVNANDNNSKHDDVPNAEKREILYQQFIKKPANALKEELKSFKVSTTGRKPDLARRLVDKIMAQEEIDTISDDIDDDDGDDSDNEVKIPKQWDQSSNSDIMEPLDRFASIMLSDTAGLALARAGFTEPTSIQSQALPLLTQRESLILHAETGSGKTLSYLLPITEWLWKEYEMNNEGGETSYALILTPTRELAAQVAGIATALSPPNSVRLVTTPTNLLRSTYEDRERSESKHGGRSDNIVGNSQGSTTKIIVGSAKSIHTSLFGDKKLPAPPTSKPESKRFVQSVKYLVMDEVDRLLDGKKTRGKTSKYYKKHEKPAATLASTIAKMTLGQVQIVAASATVGRPLRRELARVLGLTPDECPQVIRSAIDMDSTKRAITVPKTLKHYAIPCDGSTSGSLLTAAAFVAKNLPPIENRGRRILFVVTDACGIQLRDAIGALRHFGVKPEPKSLLDVLEAEGTDNLIETYRQISGSSGIGEAASSLVSFDDSEGYLLLTGEQSVRGIHLDELDTVVIVGRPKGPDEYTHIAGRAGRAGKFGTVLNIVDYQQASALTSWESMLDISFEPMEASEVQDIL